MKCWYKKKIMDIKSKKEIRKEEKEVEHGKQLGKHKVWIGTYTFLAFICIAAYFLLRLDFFGFMQLYRNFLLKLSLALFFSFIILIVSKIVERVVVTRTHAKALVYNLVRLIHFITILLV